MIVPGVVGAIALVLALFAMQILPVNFAGVLLLAVALALFILEAQFTPATAFSASAACWPCCWAPSC